MMKNDPKTAKALTVYYRTGKDEAEKYLLGEMPLESLYPYLKEWRQSIDYFTKTYRELHNLRHTDIQMYRRAVTLEGLCMRATYFCNARVYFHMPKAERRDIKAADLEEILRIFSAEGLPVEYQLDALGGIYGSYYYEKYRDGITEECVAVLAKRKEQWDRDFAKGAKSGCAAARYLCVSVMAVFWEDYMRELLLCADESSKQVRELLLSIYESHREWEPDILKMLASKKASAREMAVLVLEKWGEENYQDAFLQMRRTEKSKKVTGVLDRVIRKEEP